MHAAQMAANGSVLLRSANTLNFHGLSHRHAALKMMELLNFSS